jgi:transposase
VITIGIDPHKSSVTAVAVDLAGHELGQIRLPVRKELGGQLLGWAQAWPDRQWAVEGATGVRVRPHLQSGVRADVQRLRRVVTVVI